MSGQEEFDKAVKAAVNEAVAIQADTAGEIGRLLAQTQTQIEALLSGQPSDYQAWYLPRLKVEVVRLMDEFGTGVGSTLSAGAEASFDAGAALVDRPLQSAGVTVPLPALDRTQLEGMRAFMSHKASSVSTALANSVNAQLGLVVTGLLTPAQAVDHVQQALESSRRRALTIVRTNLGAAFSAAAQQRMGQAYDAGVKGLKKQWRRSGKIHSRISHDLADGQIQPIDKSFQVGGHDLMFPRDPNGPISEVINCGCVHLPYINDWAALHPAEKPITVAELAASTGKRVIEQARAEGAAAWISAVLDGKHRTHGDMQTVGTLAPDVLHWLELRTPPIKPTTIELALTDKQLLRMQRPAKRKQAVKLPLEMMPRIGAILANPRAVLFEKDQDVPTLHYIFDVPGVDDRPGALVVRLGGVDDRSRHSRHNFVVSGGFARRRELMNRTRFEVITGSV